MCFCIYRRINVNSSLGIVHSDLHRSEYFESKLFDFFADWRRSEIIFFAYSFFPFRWQLAAVCLAGWLLWPCIHVSVYLCMRLWVKWHNHSDTLLYCVYISQSTHIKLFISRSLYPFVTFSINFNLLPLHVSPSLTLTHINTYLFVSTNVYMFICVSFCSFFPFK